MKGKLKIWGDNPPSDLNFDGKLRRHNKEEEEHVKKEVKEVVQIVLSKNLPTEYHLL